MSRTLECEPTRKMQKLNANYFSLPQEVRTMILSNVTDVEQKCALRLLSKQMCDDVDQFTSWTNVNSKVKCERKVSFGHLIKNISLKCISVGVFCQLHRSVKVFEMNSRILQYGLPHILRYARNI